MVISNLLNLPLPLFTKEGEIVARFFVNEESDVIGALRKRVRKVTLTSVSISIFLE